LGDKSPKSKQKNKDQKDLAKAQAKSNQAKRQASYATGVAKDKKPK
jgi:hypothetical protein